MGYKFIPRPCKHTLVRNASREEAALLSFSSKQEKYDAILLSLQRDINNKQHLKPWIVGS
jgi:hypothetical protein